MPPEIEMSCEGPWLVMIASGNAPIRVDARSLDGIDVEEYAELGANVPLGGGRLIQAALVMLVAAAAERDRPEELRRLTARITSYRSPT